MGRPAFLSLIRDAAGGSDADMRRAQAENIAPWPPGLAQERLGAQLAALEEVTYVDI